MVLDKSLIKYKWEHGVFSVKEMIWLVDNDFISIQEFFDITRLHYQVMKQEV